MWWTVASGTAILEELGDEHVKTGYPIIYTSADSVFQIAAHEEVIPLEKLYEMCEIARNAEALIEFDSRLPEIIDNMSREDVLIITADHGCDPTTPSTDHSREYIPVLTFGKELKSNVNIGTRKSFCDIGKTILELLNIENEL